MFRAIPGIEGKCGRTYEISEDWIVSSISKNGTKREIKERRGQVRLAGKEYVIYDIAKLSGLPAKSWSKDDRKWEEIWADTAFGIRYRVFEDSKVQSMNQHGNIFDKTATKCGDGYMYINIGKVIKVHQLMGLTRFVPKPSNMPVSWTVHHKNKDPTNNHYTNLEWASPKIQAQDQRSMEQTKITSYPVIATALRDIIMKNGEIAMKGESERFDNAVIAAAAIVGGNRSNISEFINKNANSHHAGFSWKTPPSDPELPDEVFKSVGSGIQYERFLSAHGRIKYAFHHGYSKILEAEEIMSERQSRETDMYPEIRINKKKNKFHRKIVELFFGDLPKTISIDGKNNKLFVDHVDDVKTHSYLGNLQLLTHQENSRKRFLKSYETSVASAVNKKYERSYKTREEAIDFVKNNGYPDATLGELNATIELTISNNVPAKLYGRTWIRAHFESKNAYE
jgi:hypothetical protein